METGIHTAHLKLNSKKSSVHWCSTSLVQLPTADYPCPGELPSCTCWWTSLLSLLRDLHSVIQINWCWLGSLQSDLWSGWHTQLVLKHRRKGDPVSPRLACENTRHGFSFCSVYFRTGLLSCLYFSLQTHVGKFIHSKSNPVHSHTEVWCYSGWQWNSLALRSLTLAESLWWNRVIYPQVPLQHMPVCTFWNPDMFYRYASSWQTVLERSNTSLWMCWCKKLAWSNSNLSICRLE